VSGSPEQSLINLRVKKAGRKRCSFPDFYSPARRLRLSKIAAGGSSNNLPTVRSPPQIMSHFLCGDEIAANSAHLLLQTLRNYVTRLCLSNYVSSRTKWNDFGGDKTECFRRHRNLSVKIIDFCSPFYGGVYGGHFERCFLKRLGGFITLNHRKALNEPIKEIPGHL
jgi:hypothetical protein